MSTQTTAASASSLSDAIAGVRADLRGTIRNLLGANGSTPGNDLVTVDYSASWETDPDTAVLTYSVSPVDPTQNVWLTICGFASPDQSTVYSGGATIGTGGDGTGEGSLGSFLSEQFTPAGQEVAGIVSGYVTSSDSFFNFFQFQQNFTIG